MEIKLIMDKFDIDLLLELLNDAKNKADLLQKRISGAATAAAADDDDDDNSGTTRIISDFNKAMDYNHEEYHKQSIQLVESIEKTIECTERFPSSFLEQPFFTKSNRYKQQQQHSQSSNKNTTTTATNMIGLLNRFHNIIKFTIAYLRVRGNEGNVKYFSYIMTRLQQIEYKIEDVLPLAKGLSLVRIEEYHYLTPTPTNQQQQDHHQPNFQEYKLIVHDESCTALRRILTLTIGGKKLIWITPDSCILGWNWNGCLRQDLERRIQNFENLEIPNDYYCIWVNGSNFTNVEELAFAIYGRTQADATNCLLYLWSLPRTDGDDEEGEEHEDNIVDQFRLGDSSFDQIRFSGHLHHLVDFYNGESQHRRFLCPIEHIKLETTLLGSSRPGYMFINTIFTAQQTNVLAKIIMSGKSISFRSCTFEDEGRSFADAFCCEQRRGMVLESSSCKGTAAAVKAATAMDDSNHHHHDSPFSMPKIELSFTQRTGPDEEVPFNPNHWNRLLSSGGLSTIRLCLEKIILSPEHCVGFTTCSAQGLCIRQCEMNGNIFSHLADAIRNNRGPREIEFEYAYSNQQNDEGYQKFFEALGNDEHKRIKRLDIRFLQYRPNENAFTNIMNALRSNRSLEHLQVRNGLEIEIIGDVCDAIQNHPTILSLDFSRCGNWIENKTIDKMSNLLKKNNVIESIEMRPFDFTVDMFIRQTALPQLAWNKYRKIFHRYRTYDLRDATLATALARVSSMNHPSLLFKLVSDTIGSRCSNEGAAQHENVVAAENNDKNGAAKRPRLE